jgi:hypothetical protein
MLNAVKRALAWLKGREPVATAAALVALVGGVVAPAIADLPASASWTAVGSAVAMALVRHFVSPAS